MLIEIWNCIPHMKGNIILHQFLNQQPGALIGAVKHRHLFIRNSHLHIIPQLGNDRQCLVDRIRPQAYIYWPSLSSGGPDILGKTGCVMRNNSSCSFCDGADGAVIGIKKDAFCLGVVIFKAQHKLRPGTSKTVDRLVIVPHNKKIVLRKGQHFHNLILDPVDILKFVDQDILILALPGRKDIRPGLKQFVAHGQHIVKIQEFFSLHPFLIPFIESLKHFLRAAFGIIMVQIHQFSLNEADLA